MENLHSKSIEFFHQQMESAYSYHEKFGPEYSVILKSHMPSGYSVLHITKRSDDSINFFLTEQDQYDVISIDEAIDVCMTHLMLEADQKQGGI